MPKSRKTTSATPPKQLSLDELKAAIKTIERRMSDLDSLDIGAINGRADPAATALRLKINTSLADIFGADSLEAGNYAVSSLDTLPLVVGQRYSVGEIRSGYQQGVKRAKAKLGGLLDLLKEKLEDATDANASMSLELVTERLKSNKVFIVHGHDEEAKQTVARFIERIGLEPVILHEVANGGRTIIEKLEDEANVDFAIVLLTPDDVGASAKSPESLSMRARQNVILELGLFIGKLGRKNVCALYKHGVELPSDYSGVVYVSMDASDGWKLLLARELRQADMDVDMNRAI